MFHPNAMELINWDNASSTLGSTFTHAQPSPIPVPNPATRPSTPIANSVAQTRRGSLRREYAMIIQPPDFTLADQSFTPRATTAVNEEQLPAGLIQNFELTRDLAVNNSMS